MCDYDKSALAYNSPLDVSAKLLVGATERLVKADVRVKQLEIVVAGYKSIHNRLLKELDTLNDYIEIQRIALADMHKWYKQKQTYDRSNGLNEIPDDDDEPSYDDVDCDCCVYQQ